MTASRYRGSLLVWALLLAYASLYPFFPLRAPSPDVARDFFATRYLIRSDIAFNIIAYVPLGTLACLYFRTMSGERFAILKAAALGAALSLAMEVAQLFVPNRVGSAIDLACNAAGALLGALAFAGPVYTAITRPLGEVRERVIAV
jgi:VanZ family protein